MTITQIGSGRLTAAISSRGAELVALEADGTSLLWDGDPAWWTGRSPLLFPIVGRVPDDEILVEGRRYPLKQHGFARLSDFTCIAATRTRCSFTRAANAETRAVYPFDFILAVHYEIDGESLAVRAEVTNEETLRTMPFSFGFHPALRWPLPPARSRADHVLIFSHAELAPIARPADGLLGAARQPNPVGRSRRLALDDALFEAGALIFDEFSSTAIEYKNATGTSLRISFSNLPHLGIWTKPGAPFVCIEPWHGYAAPEGFSGELATKPGIMRLEPKDTATFDMRISIAS